MRLRTPLTEDDTRRLCVGDRVELSGNIVTARDMAHKYLIEGGKAPFPLNVIYHCGPIVKDGKAVSAGPTTSIREEPYEADIIRMFGVRAVIGKGGMGEKTRKALARYGCVYLSAVGGAGALMAERIIKVRDVYKLSEFGMPEAFWLFEVEDLPLIVAMDTRGGNLYRQVEEESAKRLNALIR
ncbi:MAG: FumA C-terminus/TtdB family hydratase beta subunit [Candidatus Altiarchaeota archaeon]